MKEYLQKWDNEMKELNHKIMELRTELAIYEGRRKEKIEERNQMINELQYKINQKDKENER